MSGSETDRILFVKRRRADLVDFYGCAMECKQETIQLKMMFACPLSPEITYAYTSLEKGSFVSELRTHFIRNQASLSGDCMPQERVWFVRGFSQTSPWCCTAESLTSWNPSLFFVFASLYLSEYFCRLKYVNTLDVYFCFLFFFWSFCLDLAVLFPTPAVRTVEQLHLAKQFSYTNGIVPAAPCFILLLL